MSLLVQLADAVLAVIDGASLPLSFTAVRSYVPVLHKEDEDSADPLATLQVCVVPRELAMVTLSRRDDDFEFAVDVGVFQRIGSGSMTADQINSACDPLVDFTEAVGDVLRSELVKADLPARFTALENVPVYDPVKLDEERLFASLLTLRFKAVRAR